VDRVVILRNGVTSRLTEIDIRPSFALRLKGINNVPPHALLLHSEFRLKLCLNRFYRFIPFRIVAD
jgi:hypothetical protein